MIFMCVMSQATGVSWFNRRALAGRLIILLVMVAVMIVPQSANAEVSLSQGRQDAKAIPGRFIVKYKEAGLKKFRDRQAQFSRLSDRDLKNVFNEALGSKRSKELQLIEADVIETEQHNIDINTASLLYSEDVIEFIEPDYELTAQLVPNDPSFKSLWGLNNTAKSGGKADADIDAPEAWDLSTGSSKIIVAVIDTGVDYNHPDLAANIWKNTMEIAGNGIDDDRNGRIDDIVGWDFANNDAAPLDDNGHGSHVAGTIAAVGNNGIGVVGVSWRSKIMPLKFLGSSGSGSTSNAVVAIDYAISNGAKVINASWGNGVTSSSLDAAIARAESKGVLFVAAAGNANNNNDTRPFYPASTARSNVISVAASDSGDNKASYSNYGATHVDLAAPGSNIYSTTKGGGYGGMSGTSMATPHVTGAAALIWSRYPKLTFLSVKAVLLGTVDKLASFEGKTVSGGRLNLFNAMGGASAVADPSPNALDAVGKKMNQDKDGIKGEVPADAGYALASVVVPTPITIPCPAKVTIKSIFDKPDVKMNVRVSYSTATMSFSDVSVTENRTIDVIHGTDVKIRFAELIGNRAAPIQPTVTVNGIPRGTIGGEVIVKATNNQSCFNPSEGTVVEIVPMREFDAYISTYITDGDTINDGAGADIYDRDWDSYCGYMGIYERSTDGGVPPPPAPPYLPIPWVVPYSRAQYVNAILVPRGFIGCQVMQNVRLVKNGQRWTWVSAFKISPTKLKFQIVVRQKSTPEGILVPVTVTVIQGPGAGSVCTEGIPGQGDRHPTRFILPRLAERFNICSISPGNYGDAVKLKVKVGDFDYGVEKFAVAENEDARASHEISHFPDEWGNYSISLRLVTTVTIDIAEKRPAFAVRNLNQALGFKLTTAQSRFDGKSNTSLGLSFTTPRQILGNLDEFPILELSHNSMLRRLEFMITRDNKLKFVEKNGDTINFTQVIGPLRAVGQYNRLVIGFSGGLGLQGHKIGYILNGPANPDHRFMEKVYPSSVDFLSPGLIVTVGGTGKGIFREATVPPADQPINEVLFTDLMLLTSNEYHQYELGEMNSFERNNPFWPKEEHPAFISSPLWIYCPLEPASRFAVNPEIHYMSPCYQADKEIKNFNNNLGFAPRSGVMTDNLGNGLYSGGRGFDAGPDNFVRYIDYKLPPSPEP